MAGVPRAVSKTNVTARTKGDMRPKSELQVSYVRTATGYRPVRAFVPINRDNPNGGK